MKSNSLIKLFLFFLGLNAIGLCQEVDAYKDFGKFWSKYTKQTDVPTLVEDVKIAMKSEQLTKDDHLRANYELLLGLLEGDTKGLSKVIKLYRSLGSAEGVRAASLALTSLLVNADQLQEAKDLLEEFRLSPEMATFSGQAKDQTDGMIAFYESLFLLKDGDYVGALAKAKDGLASLQAAKDGNRMAQMNVRIGLLQMLIGNMEEGYRTTLKAQSELAKDGEQDQYYYSMLNVLLYQRCYKQRGAELVQAMIKKRLDTEPKDKEFEQLYMIVIGWCQR